MRRPFLSKACLSAAAALGLAFTSYPSQEGAADKPPVRTDSLAQFKKEVAPVLDQHCVRCHNAEEKKGGVNFDLDHAALVKDQDLWLRALKVIRADMMPPKGRRRPTPAQVTGLVDWIKYAAFEIDPKNPDPGRVTLRRLNRTEYRNTIRDLLGVDFNVTAEFPADDTGHGFDNIGDVLNISPLLLEKYIAAAKTIVTQAVPTQPRIPAEKRYPGSAFSKEKEVVVEGPLALSYYTAAKETLEFETAKAGDHRLILDMTANETYVEDVFDYNKCRFTFKLGDKVLHTKELTRQGGRVYHLEFDEALPAGKNEVTVEIEPLTKEKQIRKLTVRIVAVTVRGPMAKEDWIRPANYERFFPGDVPEDAQARTAYAGKVLRPFLTRAYRRPIDAAMLDRLVRFAEAVASQKGQTFEGGISQAMVAVLSSPYFLFREEWTVPGSTDKYPLLDEYSLATRLSYFLWSSMPDEELLKLAGENKLRQNLNAQVHRMLTDKKSSELMRNFAGQWLHSRAIETANVNAFAVAAQEQPADAKGDAQRARLRELNALDKDKLTDAQKKELESLRGTVFGQAGKFGKGFGFKKKDFFDLTPEIRKAMRQETEMAFEHVVREDRSLLELIDADYTFLNEKLAKHYGIDKVTGDEMRKVTLPPGSLRGGILTQGTMLITTSNPDRTSPVKRGLYILDNLLGLPAPPPPADIPPLEQASAALKKAKTAPTVKESLILHRTEALCISCHARFDPLGFALENFNALGRFRDKELGQPIDPAGELLTGEAFKDVGELKKILVTERRMDFYRCATEKMLMYALGRGLETYDTHTIDEIVAQLDAVKGPPSVLISGIIQSPAFQRRRPVSDASVSKTDPMGKSD
jgi:mono/diheme cytochrome c family protein